MLIASQWLVHLYWTQKCSTCFQTDSHLDSCWSVILLWKKKKKKRLQNLSCSEKKRIVLLFLSLFSAHSGADSKKVIKYTVLVHLLSDCLLLIYPLDVDSTWWWWILDSFCLRSFLFVSGSFALLLCENCGLPAVSFSLERAFWAFSLA